MAGNELYLPERVRQWVEHITHPGLRLDKFSPPGDMKAQKESLDAVANLHCRDPEATALLDIARRRWERALPGGSLRFAAVTATPLTLHLSRANALENAGPRLHPVYGFACLPGSGLKGMTRAWAETAAGAAPAEIDAVFGWAADGANRKDSSAGGVVFHDAWPATWPELQVEITNNHHPDYYQKRQPPGDWESPVPVYFLAVAPGVNFEFALTPARGCPPETLDRARKWLEAALCHAGAGAKTAAGYGGFRLVTGEVPPLPAAERLARFETPLELVTPAFLAGASQLAADCDLHPGTLRGLLRWWWRTLHAGHVSLDGLRRMETLVWGGTGQNGGDDGGQGSAVGIRLERSDGKNPPVAYEKDTRRFYRPEGTCWRLVLTARPVCFDKDRVIPAEAILEQAQAALWLLTRYGGVGSKARKGFGSLADAPIQGLSRREDCQEAARRFRQRIEAQPGSVAEAMALEQALFARKALEVKKTDPSWRALDHAGSLLRDFTKDLDKPDRLALGLPRKGQEGPKGDRHASPVWWHLAHGDHGCFELRLTGFPAACLPDPTKSREILQKLQQKIESPPPSRPGGAAITLKGR